MDPVGGVASVLTLIKAATYLIASTRELSSKFRRAPQELHMITGQLLAVKRELELVQSTANDAQSALLTDELCTEVDAAIRQARNAVGEVDLRLTGAEGRGTFATRFRWATTDRRVVQELLVSLGVARDRLTFLLQLLSW